jgi:6-phosphogluconolactonase
MTSSHSSLLLIGCYGDAGSDALHQCRFDASTGAINIEKSYAEVINPSYLAWQNDTTLLAVSEFEPENGFLTRLNFDENTLTLVDKISSLGAAPCHISQSNTTAYVSNYFGGNVVAYDLQSPALSVTHWKQHEMGSNVVKARQLRAHIHSTQLSSDGKYLLTADLGQDKVVVYRASDLEFVSEYSVKSGAGPRHMAWLGDDLLLVNELNSTLERFSFNEGKLDSQQLIATLPVSYDPTGKDHYASEIKISQDQQFVYVSNRGHDSIVSYQVKAGNQLRLLQHIETQGSFPRHFALSPCENWLIVANQLENNVVAFKRDNGTGLLSDGTEVLTLNSPVNVLFK